MTRCVFVLLILLGIAFGCRAQREMYAAYADSARIAQENEDFRHAAELFSKAFKTLGWKGYLPDRFDAARCWAEAGEPDSATYQVTRVYKATDFHDLDLLENDPHYQSLKGHPAWEALCDSVEARRDRMFAKMNWALKRELDSIYVEDQKYRKLISELRESGELTDDKKTELYRLWQITDSSNTVRVSEILDEYGWLGSDEVGSEGNSALFLVIQHADLDVQLKYLPMMRQAAEEGKARKSSLALLIDRTNLRQGYYQEYGSQVTITQDGRYFVQPLRDPKNVDARRASMDLPPLAEYVSHWGMDWDPESYIENLQDYEDYLGRKFKIKEDNE